MKLRERSAALAACLDRVTESLRRELPAYGVDVAIDASDYFCAVMSTLEGLEGEVGGRHGNAAHRTAHLSPTADGADGGRGVPPAACLAGLNNTFRGGGRSSFGLVSLERDWRLLD